MKQCPKCKSMAPATAVQCSFCTASLAPAKMPPAAPIVHPAVTIAQPRPAGPPTCPQCGQMDAAVSVPMLYAEGHSSGTMSGLTYTPHLGVGAFGGRTSMQSAISQMLRPPTPKSGAIVALVASYAALVIGGVCMVAAFGGGGAPLFLFGAALAICAGVGIYLSSGFVKAEESYNRLEHPRILASWQGSFVCRRCNVLWDPLNRTMRPLV